MYVHAYVHTLTEYSEKGPGVPVFSTWVSDSKSQKRSLKPWKPDFGLYALQANARHHHLDVMTSTTHCQVSVCVPQPALADWQSVMRHGSTLLQET